MDGWCMGSWGPKLCKTGFKLTDQSLDMLSVPQTVVKLNFHNTWNWWIVYIYWDFYNGLYRYSKFTSFLHYGLQNIQTISENYSSIFNHNMHITHNKPFHIIPLWLYKTFDKCELLSLVYSIQIHGLSSTEAPLWKKCHLSRDSQRNYWLAPLNECVCICVWHLDITVPFSRTPWLLKGVKEVFLGD